MSVRHLGIVQQFVKTLQRHTFYSGMTSLVIAVIVGNFVGEAPADVNGKLLAIAGKKGDPGGLPLPARRGAIAVEGVSEAGLAQILVKQRLLAADLSHHGVGMLSIAGHTAVGSIVAVP